MDPILIMVSIWLHALASVVFIGFFIVLAAILLPALTKASGPDAAGRALLSQVNHHSRGWLYAAMLVFAATGIHLTWVDPNYMGIGKFGNPWTVLMLVKHLLLVGMLAAGFWFNVLWRVGPLLQSNSSSDLAVRRYRLYANSMAIGGVLVLLLTAISQVQQ